MSSKSFVSKIPVLAMCCALIPFYGCSNGVKVYEGPQQDVMEVSEPEFEAPEAPAAMNESDSKMEIAKAAVEKLLQYSDGKVAVSVEYVDGSGGFSINGDECYVSASMIKLLILAELISQVDDGSISLDAVYTLKSEDIVGGTGVIGNQGAGATFTVDSLARSMIAQSDNTATNILIDMLGMDSINTRASELGLSNTDLQRKMMDLNSGKENHMSSNDAVAILNMIAAHEIASDAMCEKAIDYLNAQTDKEALAQGLPSGIQFASKTGSLNSYRHDGGIVYGEKPYSIVVFTKGVTSPNAFMSKISNAVYVSING